MSKSFWIRGRGVSRMTPSLSSSPPAIFPVTYSTTSSIVGSRIALQTFARSSIRSRISAKVGKQFKQIRRYTTEHIKVIKEVVPDAPALESEFTQFEKHILYRTKPDFYGVPYMMFIAGLLLGVDTAMDVVAHHMPFNARALASPVEKELVMVRNRERTALGASLTYLGMKHSPLEEAFLYPLSALVVAVTTAFFWSRFRVRRFADLMLAVRGGLDTALPRAHLHSVFESNRVPNAMRGTLMLMGGVLLWNNLAARSFFGDYLNALERRGWQGPAYSSGLPEVELMDRSLYAPSARLADTYSVVNYLAIMVLLKVSLSFSPYIVLPNILGSLMLTPLVTRALGLVAVYESRVPTSDV